MVINKMPLVSIITSSYNDGLYLEEFLSSICNQTYRNIELIFVDDGSTDNTKDIIERNIFLFQKRGIILKYIYQENSGQAVATNKALKIISGKYLCWIDSDDYLFNDSIEKRVLFLEHNSDYGMVTSDFLLYYQDDERKEKKSALYKNLNWQTNQFELALIGESIIENLAQMVNVELLRRINPEMDIYETREGQNYQLILPLLYHYKRGYIDEPLACYRIHSDSHCHHKRSFDEQIIRYDNLICMLEATLRKIGISEKELPHKISNSTFYIEKRRYIDNARG